MVFFPATTSRLGLRAGLLLAVATTGAVQQYPFESNCTQFCGPMGACQLDTRECGDTCGWECVCDHGWHGDDCSVQVVVCDNPITYSAEETNECLNGGVCETYVDITDEVATRCNCQAAVGAVTLAVGHQCEYIVDEEDVCEAGLEFSTYAFCVNGGACRHYVSPGEPHPLCTCPSGFEGRHCQFASGTAPLVELIYVDSGGYVLPREPAPVVEEDLPAGHKFLIVMFTFVTVSAAVVIYRRQQQQANLAKAASLVTSDLDFDVSDDLGASDRVTNSNEGVRGEML